MTVILGVLLAASLLLGEAASTEMSCCSSATGSCRSACSKISLVSLATNANARENVTKVFSKFCSSTLVEFWDCVNSTLKDVERNENWTGRNCCSLARGPLCRSTCARAGARHELRPACRWSDEPELGDCLDRRDEADSCCATVPEAACREICRDVFQRPGSRQSTALKLYSTRGCFHQVPRCLKNAVDTRASEDPKNFVHCCEQAPSPICQETCRRSLHSLVGSVHEILDALEDSCGKVVPHSPLWSCFLKSSPAKTQRLPLNVGKLSCCSRAQRRACQNLCWRAFQTDWAAWQQLEVGCLGSSTETELRRCLEDTEDSCEMGCSGLGFCSKFNDRPTQLFRTCTASADESAKWEADHWLRGGLITGLGVPVRASAYCPVDTLRAAACLLQLRPCESRVHESRLCREDCIELVTNCVDWPAVKGQQSAATLCAKIAAPKSDAPCVSLGPFLEEPRARAPAAPPLGLEDDVNVPCRHDPCPQGQICAVQHDDRRNYRCLPGCTLGEMSKQQIPVGSWAQIPRSEHPGCYRICQCSASGQLDKCRDLNCLALNTCWVQSSFVAHRSSFYLECKPCLCFEGEISCSRRPCASPAGPGGGPGFELGPRHQRLHHHQPQSQQQLQLQDEAQQAGLPCDCPGHYVPVCGRLGVTHASACLAKCAGLLPSEVEYNSCSSKDPCAARPCRPGERCVRRARVCLSPIHKPCEQFECVPAKCDHKDDNRGAVCDTDNRQHSSLCSLIRSGSSLAYRGPCLRGCGLRGPVCGVNGESYPSECAAWAERAQVDYPGPCAAVGLVLADRPGWRCPEDEVVCPPLARRGCLAATPPGACCPVCAGAARLFYSKKQLDRIYYQLTEESDKQAVTLEAMLSGLSRQLQVAECVLRGSLTPEGDIFVLVLPISRRPSELQLSACAAEAEKLVTRIAERSPRIAAEVPLSALIRAEVAHARMTSAADAPSCSLSLTLLGGLLLGVLLGS